MSAPTSMLPGTRPDWGPDGEPVWQPPRTENARRGWRNAFFIAVALIAGLVAVGTTKVDKSKVTAAEASATVANQRADNAVGVARQQSDAALAGRSAQLDSREQALNKRQADLDAREKTVVAAEAARRAISFNDGTYQVGVDIQPGTYHAPGPAGTDQCFWKKVGPADQTLESYHQPGPAVVTIDLTAKFFSTHGCGVWMRR